MKTTSKGILFRCPRGIAAMPLIALIALMLTSSLVFVMRRGIASKDAAAHIQLRTDYRQREDALVRSLIAIVPNKAIGCMQTGSVANAAQLNWNQIFAEAIVASNGGVALTDANIATLGLPAEAKNANTGNNTGLTAAGLLVPLVTGAPDVLAGNTTNDALFAATSFAGKLPPTLGGDAGVLANDNLYPIISRSKIVTTMGANLDYDLDPAAYPLYNRVLFPDVRLSFAIPGNYVVGKRNWWAFSVEYGGGTGLGTVRKNYLLSIYELPNQLPISASDGATIGAYSDGTAWNAGQVTVTGGIFADRLTSAGGFDVDRLLGRESVAIGAGTRVGLADIGNDFDALGQRELMAKSNGAHILPVAVASNAGKVSYISLKRNDEFYTATTNAAQAAGILSDTTWDGYTAGPDQCAIKIEITQMAALAGQEPTSITVTYLAGGAPAVRTFTRGPVGAPGANPWPDDAVISPWDKGAPGEAALLPFQGIQATGNAPPGLIVNVDRLAAWLVSVGGDPIAVNNSIYVTPVPSVANFVNVPNMPPSRGVVDVIDDPAVILNGAGDLSAFTSGFALVTNLPCYTQGDVNQTPIAAPPLDAALPGGAYVYYPPFALFTPDFHVGTGGANLITTFSGQLSSVGQSGGGQFDPLRFKSGALDAVASANITADLTTLVSPAELPPVLNMNWMITVEEIH